MPLHDSGSEVGDPRTVIYHISVNNGDFWGSARLLEYLVFLIIEKYWRYAQSILVKILMDFKKKSWKTVE